MDWGHIILTIVASIETCVLTWLGYKYNKDRKDNKKGGR